MNNEYIEIYQEHKYHEQKDTIDALIETLERLKSDTEKQQSSWLHSILRGTKNGLLGFFKDALPKSNSPETLVLIEQIIANLTALKHSDTYQEEGETANTQLEFLAILGPASNALPESKLQELLNNVMFNEGSNYFSMRESSIIEPSPIEILSGEEEPYEEEQQWAVPYIEELLARKNLPQDIFYTEEKNQPRLENGIEEHVRWAFNNIYNYYYPYGAQEEALARVYHGIEHVSRAAVYAKVFANLYRKHGDLEAENLSEEDLKLIQIALIFHDSAREDENVDRWDHESAIFLYYYLTRVLGVEPQKARFLAEATANKDPSPEKGYFELFEHEDGEISWQFTQNENHSFPEKNIFQKIIHDCDCLDIIRARNQFDARYLDFYKEIASKAGNEIALEEMAEFIMEARGLIYTQGDSRIKLKLDVKKRYEHEDAYASITADLHADTSPIIFALHGRLLDKDELKESLFIDLSPFDKTAELSGNNLKAALREGQILVRGIATPSAKPKAKPHKEAYADATLAEKEIRKTMRSGLINVKRRKAEPIPQHNNPLRSVSILGYGSGVYPSAGMLIFNPDVASIRKISSEDFDSGRGSKKKLAHLQEKEYRQTASLLEQEYTGLIGKMKIGLFGRANTPTSNYPEILYDINHYDAIFYTNDPVIANEIAYDDPEPSHPFSPLLQAIYLQQQYEQQYESTKTAFILEHGETQGLALFLERFGANKTLPIYEYSGQNNRIQQVAPKELTEEHIIEMWLTMCSDFMKKQLRTLEESSLYAMSVDEIKLLSMYKYKENSLAKINQPADLNYPSELRDTISLAIEKEKERLIAEHEAELWEKLNNNELSVFSNEYFIPLNHSTELQALSTKKIKEELRNFIQSAQESSFTNDLIIENNAFRFVPINDLNELSPIKLSNNTLIKAYRLAKQFAFEEEAQQISRIACASVNALILEWCAPKDTFSRMDHLSKALNLRETLRLINADENTLAQVDQFLLDTLRDQMEQQANVFKLSRSIADLFKTNTVRPEHLEIIRHGYNQLREKITQFNGQDLTGFLRIGICLGEKPQEEFIQWLATQKQLTRDALISFKKPLAKILVFDDTNLDVFKECIEKIHPYENLIGNYVEFNHWFACINEVKNWVANKEFSPAQLEIINDRCNVLADKFIKVSIDESRSFFYRTAHPNKQQCKLLRSYAEGISDILKQGIVSPPDNLIEGFNQNLLELDQQNFSNSGLEQHQVNLFKKLHKQLPQQELRQEAIDRLDEELILLKQAISEPKPQPQAQQPQLGML
ncbi:hypothetical protein J2N86_09990 [Legionella lytica]|uniref:SidE PDE domain-containing protein n=1 Tax=Legionella lytica TaxID=96232 RepID=A0ABY4Y5X3_9GAMM|nr:SidE phosphodiesterase domain-containing protein [Legionella lytica]USQ13033.1 hypothetical protein J2N86_09990 [Legionella lytica]